MKRHNVNKAPAIRAVMSMIMATAIFLQISVRLLHTPKQKPSHTNTMSLLTEKYLISKKW